MATTLYLVVAPNGNIAYAGPDAARVEFYRPAERDTYVAFERYELYVIHGVQTPWIDNREEKRRLRENPDDE